MKKWNNLILLVFILFMFGQATFGGSGLSEETAVIINKMTKEGALRIEQSEHVNKKPDNNFTMLKSIAKKEELFELINHENKIVRCYAFWVLSNYDSVDLFPIIVKHIDDNEKINVQLNDLIESGKKVGDFFIDVVTSPKIFLEANKLTSEQISKLDYLLITTPNELISKNVALMRIEPKLDMYKRIRELYLKENNQSALVALSKYRNEQDIELILNNRERIEDFSDAEFPDDPQRRLEIGEQGFFYTYAAIANFPNEKFFPLLRKNLSKALDNTLYCSEWKNLYKAIAGYKNSESLMLLKIPFTQVAHKNMRRYHLEDVYNAIEAFKNPIYDDLFWKLWKEENIIKLDGYNYLRGRYHKKTLEMTKKFLLNTNEEFYDTEIINELLNVASAQDETFLIKVIIQKIAVADVTLFPIFVENISKIGDKSLFVEPLFNRLNKESNPHIFLKIAEILIGYNDDNINKRILNTREKCINLRTGWGGDALNKMLEKFNLI